MASTLLGAETFGQCWKPVQNQTQKKPVRNQTQKKKRFKTISSKKNGSKYGKEIKQFKTIGSEKNS